MKSHRVPRAARKVVVVCLALAALLLVSLAFAAPPAAAHASPAYARVTNAASRTTIDETVRAKVETSPRALRESGATILAFPPASAAPASAFASSAPPSRAITVVYLHGIHGLPANGCPWLRDGATAIGWLVCPEANQRLTNGTFSWGGTVASQREVVARAERAAQAQGADPAAANVLVGFSQGAYVALDLVHAHLGRYRGLVLIGADVTPSRQLLQDGGVSRIVLAAGDLDGASEPMKRAAEQLRREGIDVRFVSLGRIGHSYATPDKEALRDAIVWAGTSS